MLAPYLTKLKHVKARNALLRFRLGVSQIKTHKYRNTKRINQDYACPFCKDIVETEAHFVLVCPAYDVIRIVP